jgi:Glycosyl transferases group 1
VRAIGKYGRVRVGLTIGWPVDLPDSGTRFWAEQILSGLRASGARIDPRQIPQHPPTPFHVLLAEIDDGPKTHAIAFDLDDCSEIVEPIAEDVLLYFKSQYADGGYRQASVVPGGYHLANNAAYRYLRVLRAVRARTRFRYDVYGRFGLRYGGARIRRRAFQVLSARRDFQFEGNLFRYPGGPDKVPYRRHMFDIARAKVCVDMPGGGDLCTRLVDYLAVGACVVGPPPSTRLPIRLVDGVHLVYCAPDLSDLGSICAELVRDDEERERIAWNARDFFDRYLHRRQLAAYYIEQITHASAAASDSHPVSRRVPPSPQRIALDEALASQAGRRRTSRPVRRALPRLAALAMAAITLLVALPEMLGDRPYDPRPSSWIHAATGHHRH